MKQFFHKVLYFVRSMKVQVLFMLLVIGLVPLFLLFYIMTNSYESRLVTQRVDELQSYGTMISNLVVSSGYLTEQDSPEVETEAAEVAEIYHGRIILVDKDLRVVRIPMIWRTARLLFQQRLYSVSGAREADMSMNWENICSLRCR